MLGRVFGQICRIWPELNSDDISRIEDVLTELEQSRQTNASTSNDVGDSNDDSRTISDSQSSDDSMDYDDSQPDATQASDNNVRLKPSLGC